MFRFATVYGYTALALGLLIVCVRLARGPSLADRVVALDLVAYLVIAFVAVHAFATGQHVMLDAAIVLALVAFVGTVAFARYVERQGAPISPAPSGEAGAPR